MLLSIHLFKARHCAMLAISVVLGIGSLHAKITGTRSSHFTSEMGDDEVREIIRGLVPSLVDSNASRPEQAERLRDWLHQTIPVADPHANLARQGVDHNKDPLAELLYQAEMRFGGYFCGGISEIARQVYILMGFEAITMNFGIREIGSTHVMLLVKLPVRGTNIWTVQDTYFNSTFRDHEGEYLGFKEFLNHLSTGRFSEVVVDETKDARTPSLYQHGDKVPRISRRYRLDAECVDDWSGFSEYSVTWDFHVLDNMMGLRDQMKASFTSDSPLQLFLFPLNSAGGSLAKDLLEHATDVRDVFLAQQLVSLEDFQINAIAAYHDYKIRAKNF